MKTKCCLILTCALFMSNVLGTDGIPFLEGRFPVFSVTPTNLTVTFQPNHARLIIKHMRGVPGRLSEYGEELVLTLNQETILTDGRHGTQILTPVSFKNQQKGFRITNTFFFPGRGTTTNIAYVALSTTLTRMREEDVEMIMEAGEWVKYGKPQPETEKGETTSPVKKGGAATLPPSRDDGQGNAQSKPNLWLYVGVSLCALCAILYFLRRKLKTGN